MKQVMPCMRQNIGDNIYDTILGTGVSLGIHESQSRFYENLVGKNKAFWDRNYSELQDLFAENLADTSIEEFYKAINKVSPSLIRVEADELTYSLHILVRFEIEKEIFEKILILESCQNYGMINIKNI